MHRAPWPIAAPLRTAAAGHNLTELTMPGHALATLRKLKSEAKVSMRTPILRADLAVPADAVASIQAAESDLRNAGRVTGDLNIAAATADQGDPHAQGGIVVVASELGEAPAKTPRN